MPKLTTISARINWDECPGLLKWLEGKNKSKVIRDALLAAMDSESGAAKMAQDIADIKAMLANGVVMQTQRGLDTNDADAEFADALDSIGT